MLAENHSIIHPKTRFADVEKSIKFLLEIITLVSSYVNVFNIETLALIY
jgi:hypothetical protein